MGSSLRLNTFFSSVFPDTRVKMTGVVGGALKSFRALVNNWEKNQNAELKLNCKDGHWLVNYSWTWVCGWPYPPAPLLTLPAGGHQGPRKGAGSIGGRGRAAVTGTAETITEKVVTKSVVEQTGENAVIKFVEKANDEGE